MNKYLIGGLVAVTAVMVYSFCNYVEVEDTKETSPNELMYKLTMETLQLLLSVRDNVSRDTVVYGNSQLRILFPHSHRESESYYDIQGTDVDTINKFNTMVREGASATELIKLVP